MKQLLILTFIINSISLFSQPNERSDFWQLVWEDNFDSLNTDIWLVENHFDHWGGEPQVYTSRPENVFINDGSLVLRVNREDYSCPPESVNQWRCARQFNTGQTYEFTSGWIETRQPDYNTQYGLIEARIKLPYGFGFWPAFWTFKADNVGATNAAEIDIFEMLGHKPSNRITTNIHLEYCNEEQPDYPVCAGIPSYYQENVIATYANTWHRYAIEWTPTYLQWWIDDYVFRWEHNPGVHGPIRTILNMAIEPGYPPNIFTPFPSDYFIDYVRVYSLVTATSESHISESELSISPNPARQSSSARIQAQGDLIIQNLQLVSLTGQVHKSVKAINQALYDLDISELVPGIYFVNIETNKGPTNRSLFIQ